MDHSKAYLALARKWRPQQFEEVLGQVHVTRTLANAIRLNRLGHAYLLTGPRGIGKTTLARILAKAVNCAEGPTPEPCDKCPSCLGIIAGNSLDVIEIDGASNRGINEIRELRENVKFAPSSSRFKVYIIDEVHMLTTPAFNALLKTLEEPPPAVKFVFATTDPHKLPSTIVSRCQRFDLRKLAESDLIARFKEILNEEKREYEEEALKLLAGFAGGSMRDGESILDQLLVYCDEKISANDVIDLVGAVPDSVVRRVSDCILESDRTGIIKAANDVFERGWDLGHFVSALVKHFHEELYLLLTAPQESSGAASVPEKTSRFTRSQLTFIIEELLKLESAIKIVISPRVAVELALVKLAGAPGRVYLDELIGRLEALERSSGPAPGSSAGPRRIPDRKIKRENPSSGSPPAPAVGLETIKKNWPDFLESLGTVRPRLKTYLAAGEPTDWEEGRLTVCFDEGHLFHRDELESPAHRAFLETMLKNKLGSPVVLKFTIAPLNQGCSPGSRTTDPRAKKKILKDHPLVREALASFDASVESIKE